MLNKRRLFGVLGILASSSCVMAGEPAALNDLLRDYAAQLHDGLSAGQVGDDSFIERLRSAILADTDSLRSFAGRQVLVAILADRGMFQQAVESSFETAATSVAGGRLNHAATALMDVVGLTDWVLAELPSGSSAPAWVDQSRTDAAAGLAVLLDASVPTRDGIPTTHVVINSRLLTATIVLLDEVAGSSERSNVRDMLSIRVARRAVQAGRSDRGYQADDYVADLLMRALHRGDVGRVHELSSLLVEIADPRAEPCTHWRNVLFTASADQYKIALSSATDAVRKSTSIEALALAGMLADHLTAVISSGGSAPMENGTTKSDAVDFFAAAVALAAQDAVALAGSSRTDSARGDAERVIRDARRSVISLGLRLGDDRVRDVARAAKSDGVIPPVLMDTIWSLATDR